MARKRLNVGDTCKGIYGPHKIESETDLERGVCKPCKREGCRVHREKALAKNPQYNTDASRSYRQKMLQTDPNWDTARKHKEQKNDPFRYLARCMLSSLRRADRLMGRVTDPSVTTQTIALLVREGIGKPCPAIISCNGGNLRFVPKGVAGSPSLDHVNPDQSPTTMDNLRVICFDCNFSKSDLTLAEAKAVVSYIERNNHAYTGRIEAEQRSPRSTQHATA